MPTTREKIDAEKKTSVDTLDDQIQNAQDEKVKTGNQGLEPEIKRMLAQRAVNDAQAYAASLKDEDMKAALALLEAATTSMKATAAEMVGATKIIEKASTLVAGGAKVVTILKTGKA